MENRINLGTPKTLNEALWLAICVGPLKDIEERSYNVMRDFVAQKFATAMLKMGMWREGSSTKYTPEEIIKECFDELVKKQSATSDGWGKHD